MGSPRCIMGILRCTLGNQRCIQALKYLKIGTCPASQKLFGHMGITIISTRHIKIFTCPAAWGTRKYERTSVIFEAWYYGNFCLKWTILTHLTYRANAKKTCDIVTVLKAFGKSALADVNFTANDVSRGDRLCNVVFTLERRYIFM